MKTDNSSVLRLDPNDHQLVIHGNLVYLKLAWLRPTHFLTMNEDFEVIGKIEVVETIGGNKK